MLSRSSFPPPISLLFPCCQVSCWSVSPSTRPRASWSVSKLSTRSTRGRSVGPGWIGCMYVSRSCPFPKIHRLHIHSIIDPHLSMSPLKPSREISPTVNIFTLSTTISHISHSDTAGGSGLDQHPPCQSARARGGDALPVQLPDGLGLQYLPALDHARKQARGGVLPKGGGCTLTTEAMGI